MKTITCDQFHHFLYSIREDFEIVGPVILHDGTLSLGRLTAEPLALFAGRIPFRFTSLFFPHSERLFAMSDEYRFDKSGSSAKPLLVVGWRAEDLEALEFIDEFFRTGFRDDVFCDRRQSSVVIGVSGRCGVNGEFCRISEGKCDMELIYDGKHFIMAEYTENGRFLSEKIVWGEETDSLEALLQESRALRTPEREILQTASQLLMRNQVDDDFWAEIADRCIQCTSCTNVCPTCTCFDVYDMRLKRKIERYRMWDSCQMSGFMREASGHNPLASQSDRTRRRIRHKLVDDLHRWGRMTCFLCGRCDDVCPTGIGMKAVAAEIVERFG
ncbi:MAG: hypothetical protein C4527_21585 [Candidatus Omnitrophota bacterium]|jgi:ferredoxin|nr:MAG: hypothetical protein C4527_21585 [Candidatus Omnitrophota bacterium]